MVSVKSQSTGAAWSTGVRACGARSRGSARKRRRQPGTGTFPKVRLEWPTSTSQALPSKGSLG